jgi:hypothetical protein
VRFSYFNEAGRYFWRRKIITGIAFRARNACSPSRDALTVGFQQRK